VPRTRRTRRVARGLRYLLPGVAAAALLVAPGTAWAAGDGTSPTDPLGGLVQQGSTALGQAVGGAPDATGGAPGVASDSGSTNSTGAAGQSTTDATGAADQAGASSLPQPLQDALAQLGISSACSTAVQEDLTKTLTDIPGSVQAIIDELTSQLGSGQAPTPQAVLEQLAGRLGIPLPAAGAGTSDAGSEDATGATAADTGTSVPILDDLQQLVTDLTTLCKPSLPSPPPPGDTTPPATGVDDQNTPPQETQSTPPAAQPVSYPGYAATGAVAPARSEHPVGTAPLAVLGGGILLVSGAATAAVRSRARRSGR
jgi:hypothetical protein